MDWSEWRRALAAQPLPIAVVDLDVLGRNVGQIRAQVESAQKRLRVATKSLRHVGLLRRILEWGGSAFQGFMCYSLEEACFLVDEGFDDLLVAYPSVRAEALKRVAGCVAQGATIRLIADSREHLVMYQRVARASGVRLEVVLELDVAYQPLGVHLGALRSPVRTPGALFELARWAAGLDGVAIVGLMAYEAHIAGLTDDNPFQKVMSPAHRALKQLAIPALRKARASAISELESTGIELRLINGGGTGSLGSTLAEPGLNEVTVGSGFLCPHLFDYYRGCKLEPAAFFALEVSRIPQPGIVTCHEGGYVASGAPGWDRLPRPWRPEGLSYVPAEGAGEVQTPLRVARTTPVIEIGDPIIFRHAKSGELAEHFNAYHLLEGGRIVTHEPTYRGLGQCF